MATCLLIIDPQVDFHEGGSLPVSGATKDSERIAEFIRANLGKIDEIIVTLDSHHSDHIAHAKVWKNARDEQPSPFTQITSQHIRDGLWRPVTVDLEYALRYTESLERKGKFFLTIWPEHCIEGTPGHDIFPTLKLVLDYWSESRGRTWKSVKKGQNVRTEMYSVLEAEIPDESDPKTFLNESLLQELRSFDRVLVCGQALSHCVNHTIRDLFRYLSIEERSRVTVFKDGSSVVSGCERQGEEFLSFVQSEGGTVANLSETTL